MRVLQFNALGRPNADDIASGAVLQLMQDGEVGVVQVEILPPDDFGPSLFHPANEASLAAEALQLVQQEAPDLLTGDRAWTVECPPSLAARAIFEPDE